MFRHGRYSLDKRPVGGWSSGQYKTCCQYCRCIVLTARKHDVYTIRHPRKLRLGGVQLLGHLQSDVYHVYIYIGGRRRLPAGAIRKESYSRDFRPHCPRKCLAWTSDRHMPHFRRMWALNFDFLSMPHYPLSLFFSPLRQYNHSLLVIKNFIIRISTYIVIEIPERIN